MQNSNVIHVNFKTKQRIEISAAVEAVQVEPKPEVKGKRKPAKRMNKGEFHALTMRVTEIEAALDLCDPSRDEDVMVNLETELAQLDARLSEAMGA